VSDERSYDFEDERECAEREAQAERRALEDDWADGGRAKARTPNEARFDAAEFLKWAREKFFS